VKQMALAMWEARKGFEATNAGNESRAPSAVRLSNSAESGQSSYNSSRRLEKYELLRIFRMASLLMSWKRNTLKTSRFIARNRE